MGHDAGEVTVRRGEARDLAAVAEIQEAAGSAAQWQPGDYLAYNLLVAASAERAAGFIVTRQVAAAEGEILNLAVHPRYQRRGIGSLLLQAVLPGAAVWFLEVRASNRSAIAFYRSAGFVIVGARRGYYSEPAEDAIVMRIGS